MLFAGAAGTLWFVTPHGLERDLCRAVRGVDADKVRYTGVVKRYETFAEMARLLARTDQIRADVEEGKIVLCIDRDDD